MHASAPETLPAPERAFIDQIVAKLSWTAPARSSAFSKPFRNTIPTNISRRKYWNMSP